MGNDKKALGVYHWITPYTSVRAHVPNTKESGLIYAVVSANNYYEGGIIS